MVKMIERTILVLFSAACLYVTARHGLHYAVILLGAGIIAYVTAYNWLEAYKRRTALANAAVQIDNSYIYSESKDDRTVRQRSRHEAALLTRSGNKEFLKGNIQVHALYFVKKDKDERMVEFDDGLKNVRSWLVICEDYERFLDMVQEHEERVEIDHHVKIAKEDGEWYATYALKQD